MMNLGSVGNKLLVVMVSMLALFSCSDTSVVQAEQSTQTMPYIRVYSMDGKQLQRIDDQKKVASIMTGINAMAPRYEKILPIYRYQVDIIESDSTSSWLMSTDGYMTPKGEEGQSLYLFKKPSLFLNEAAASK